MSVAKFYPFNGERGRLRLGLNAIKTAEWIQYEDNFAERIKIKKQLVDDQRSRVLDALSSSLTAQQEFLQLVLAYLKQYHSDRFSVDGNSVTSKSDCKSYTLSDYESCPLELVSYLVVDDFCLLEEDGEDYKLVAASVCAPTWWTLAEKMGRPLASIHSPIKNLEQKIGRMIRHFLQNLKVEDCYQRSNWFLFSRPDYCVFPNSFEMHKEMSKLNVDNIEDHLYLRSERQTFRRLEKTNCIVFGIKVYVEPINLVKKYPAIAEDLLIAINTMANEQKQALGISLIEQPLEHYLQKILQVS